MHSCPKNNHIHVFAHDCALNCGICGKSIEDSFLDAAKRHAENVVRRQCEMALRKRLSERAEKSQESHPEAKKPEPAR